MALTDEVISVYDSDFTNDGWERPKFFDQAACTNKPELFFPKRGGNYEKGRTRTMSSSARARKVCDTCIVWEECFDYAMQLSRTVPGIYAGMSTDTRISIRKSYRDGRITREQAISLARRG